MKGVSKIFQWGLVLSVLLGPASVRGQGTISLGSVFARARVCTDLNCSQGYPYLPTTASFVFGVFWSTNRADLDSRALQPVLPLGSSYGSIPGLIYAPFADSYPIPGTEPGQKVWMRIRAWPAFFGTNWQSAGSAPLVAVAATDVREITLGPTAGPGTVIWQSSSGSSENRFLSLTIYNFLDPADAVVYSIRPTLVLEQRGGSAQAIFTVTRACQRSLAATTQVNFRTAPGTASAGQDYVPTNGTIRFEPFETTREVAVNITGDFLPEPDEQFTVTLEYPWGTIGTGTATGTITEAGLIGLQQMAGGTELRFDTIAGIQYSIESTVDLSIWLPVEGATNFIGTGEPMIRIDPAPDCCGHRFYRLRRVTPF
jgi:hypothetical protein